MSKPILLIDFDGVIHSYESGWKGVDQIVDIPVPGAFQFLMKAIEKFDVQIYSSRSKDPEGVRAMDVWFWHWAKMELSTDEANKLMHSIRYPTEKPAAFLTIDDRAICFQGSWPTIESMLAFKPWNKR